MTLNYPTSIENVWSVENSNIACFCSGENIYEGFEPKIKGKKQVLLDFCHIWCGDCCGSGCYCDSQKEKMK